MLRGGVLFNLLLSKSLKRHELKLRGGVIINLPAEPKSEKARVEA
jgi:hypothetical protein